MSTPGDISLLPMLMLWVSASASDGRSPHPPSTQNPLDTIPETSEYDLIRRLQQDDHTAFETIYRALHPRLVAIAYGYVHSLTIAEDLAQDALLILWDRRTIWTENDSVVVYLDVTVRNLARMYLRHEGVIGRLEASARAEQAVVGTAGHIESPDAIVERENLLEVVQRTLKCLPVSQRTAFTLRWIHQLDYDEVGRAMGISTVAARKLVSRARSAIVSIVADHIAL